MGESGSGDQPCPAPQHPSRRFLQSDLYLDRRPAGFDAYFAGRAGPTGADLGVGLSPGTDAGTASTGFFAESPGWDYLDLGEAGGLSGRQGRNVDVLRRPWSCRRPSPYRARKTYAKRVAAMCDRPFIKADGTGWHGLNAIDPEPVIVGQRLYLYFGGGTTISGGGGMDGRIGVRVYRLPSKPNGGREAPR